VWTDEFGDEVVDLITEAVELEKITPTRRVLTKYFGMGTEQFAEYVEHIADRRLGRLGLTNSTGLTIRSRDVRE